MHIRFVHQPPLRIGPVCLKISSLKLPSRDKNIHLARVILLVRHKPGASIFQRSTSGSFFRCIQNKTTRQNGSSSHVVSLTCWQVSACASSGDRSLKGVTRERVSPPGRLRWTQMTLTCRFNSKYRKKKVDVYKNWQWCRCWFAMIETKTNIILSVKPN